MSTRFTKQVDHQFAISQGYEGTNTPDDFHLPPCTLEDVDKAIFNLFNKSLPLYAKIGNETVKAPVIFATGERFALLRRRQPLRDEQNALILPLVSILRDSIDQEAGIGFGVTDPMPFVIKRRLHERDAKYQKVLNKLGLKNASNEPGTRRTTGTTRYLLDEGSVLQPDLKNNIYETIIIPPAMRFQANYEVTLWTQYTTQMNDMIMTIMSAYQNMHKPQFRIETESGYWFVAYVESTLSPGNNFDDFTDDERIVRYSFKLNVPAFIIGHDGPGMPSGIRSFVSAPTVQFELQDSPGSPARFGGPPDPDANAYILENIQTEDSYLPGQALGSDSVESGKLAADVQHGPGAYRASSDARDARDTSAPGTKSDTSANVGGHSRSQAKEYIVRVIVNPDTGETREVNLRVSGQVSQRGETVLRGEQGFNLGDIILE